MRAVAKRKAWVQGEDIEHNVKFSCYSERASHLPTTTNLLAAIVTISIPNNIKKKNNNFILPKFEKAGIVTSLLDITTRVNIRKIRHSVPGCGGHVCFSCH